MALEEEITSASKEIITDGYEMSLGEISSLYKDKEIDINPNFQRLFRWELERKSKFIESVLLGIPLPAIFVYQNSDGVWELVDGLQRLSTVFEFMGILRHPDGGLYPPSILVGTKLLPSLEGIQWEASTDNEHALSRHQQLLVKRARMRIEILKKESDPLSKFELFQRLNTGGVTLTEQEIRNNTLIMINNNFYEWISNTFLTNEDFIKVTPISERNIATQKRFEYAIRFLSYINYPYAGKIDVHEYLDDCAIRMASDSDFDYTAQHSIFSDVFVTAQVSD